MQDLALNHQKTQLLKSLSFIALLKQKGQYANQQIKAKIQTLSDKQVDQLLKEFKDSLSQMNYQLSGELIRILKAVVEFSRVNIDWNFQKEDFDRFAGYISNMELNLEQSIWLIQIIYLDKGYLKITQSEALFKTLLQQIFTVKGQNLQLLLEILVQMMKDNRKLILLANKPYFFLQYWLHTINQQTQPDRKNYWINCVKLLYEYPKSEQYLFYKNDFRTLIDILISTIENASLPFLIKKCLQCYLVLTCTNIIKENGIYYRLEDLRQKIMQSDVQYLGIQKQADQILTIDD